MFRLIVTETIGQKTASRTLTYPTLDTLLRDYNQLYIYWRLERQPKYTTRSLRIHRY